MKPNWISEHDNIPLDPLIAPMALFLNNSGIKTLDSCQGGVGHHSLVPTIRFKTTTWDQIEALHSLLKANNLHHGVELGLMMHDWKHDKYGMMRWRAADVSHTSYRNKIYPVVMKLVDMSAIADFVEDVVEWKKRTGANW